MIEKETEIKFKIDENTLNKLKNLKLTSYEEIDEYFTTKEMLKNDIFLRLRSKHEKIFLQMKNVTKGGEEVDCYEADEIHMELTQEQYQHRHKLYG